MLGTPPALILSQDQTLEFKCFPAFALSGYGGNLERLMGLAARRGFNPSKYSLGLDSLYLVFKEQAPSGAIGEITASIPRRQGKFTQGPQFQSV